MPPKTHDYTNRPRLTAALIVCDEEDFLPGCLASLTGITDEIVVVDTGSRDASPDIAREAGATVRQHVWRDDFAAARNIALDAAQGDWILYIDADERVANGLSPALARQLDDARLVGLTVRFQPAAGFTPYREHRLFRRHPDIRFEGSIHETHLPSLQRHAARHALRSAHSDLGIRHLGYDGDMGHKHRRNLPLLEARVRQDPDHTYVWWHLGQTRRGLGQETEAVAAWRQGLAASRRRRRQDGAAALPYLALLQCEAGPDEGLLAEALERFPDHPQLRWLRARKHIEDGHPEQAHVDLEALIAIDPAVPVGRDFAVETRLFERLVPRALAHIYFRLGRFPEAAALFRRLRTAPGTSEEERAEYDVKARLAEVRASRAPTGDVAARGARGAPRVE